MGTLRTAATRIAGTLLLSLALFGCESTPPVLAPDLSQDARALLLEQEIIEQQTIEVEIEDVYSGDPPQASGTVNLEDEWLYVEILDPLQYRPSGPAGAIPFQTASDVRIGEDWETGTPAESFELLDINNDGVLDIRVRWDLQQLIDDGHLGPQTESIEVWGRDPLTGQLYQGEAEVTIVGPPDAMEDLVVLNDLNVFHNIAIDFVGTDNQQFVRNLVNFSNAGPRSQGTVVWWDRGRACRCLQLPDFQRTIDVIATAGFSVEVIQSEVGDRFLDIPLNVRSIWLWTPTLDFSTAEMNALKQFVQEGGRLMFIGENGAFYTAAGLATMNSFLTRMGVSIRTIGGTAGVGYTTTPNIEPHPLMQGVSTLRFAGAGILTAGPEADVMFYDHTGANILAATEPIDPTPLTGREVFPLFRDYLPLRGPATATGQ